MKKKRKKLLIHFFEDFYFGHCGDPWQEVYELKVYDDGFIEFMNFADDRIPGTIVKTLKTDYVSSFCERILPIIERYKAIIQDLYPSEIYYADNSKGFIYIKGLKKIEHSSCRDSIEKFLGPKEILNSFFHEVLDLIKDFHQVENFYSWRGLE